MNTDICISKFHEEAFEGILNKLRTVNPKAIDESHIVIVPDRYSLSIEKLIYGGLNCRGSFNITVLTLKRLSAKISSLKKYISVNGAVMLVKKAVNSVLHELKCFDKSVRYAGFAESIYNEITRYKNSFVSAEKLLKISEETDGELKYKLFDISLIYKKYEELINDSYIDTQGYINLITDNAKNSSLIKKSCFYFAGFDDFNKSEALCIKEIILNSRYCCFALTQDTTCINDICDIAKNLNFDINTYYIENKRDGIASAIYENIESYKTFTYNGECKRISLSAFSDCLEETENAAQQILKDIRQKNYRFKDITVVLSGINNYLYPLDKIFKKYGISYYISESSFLDGEPLFKALYNLLTAVAENCDFSNVMAFVKSVYFGEEQGDVEVFENYCLKFGINRNRFLQPFTAGDESDCLETAEKIRIRFAYFYNLIKNINDSVLNFTECTRKILKEFKNCDIANNLLCNYGYLDEADFRSQAFDKIVKLLSEFDDILSNETMSLKEYKETLLSGVESVKMSIIPISADVVCCGGFDLPRYLNSKAVYILGVVEGEFPCVKFPPAIIPFNDLKKLLPDHKEGDLSRLLDKEHKKIKRLLCCEGDLHISCYTGGETGKAFNPSEYFLKLKKMFALKVTNNLQYSFKREYANFDFTVKSLKCAKDLFFSGGTTSISAIETYFSCPRKFLFRYGFFAFPRKDSSLKSLDRGIFLHSAIELFVKKYNGNDVDILANQCFESVISGNEYKRFYRDAADIASFEKLKDEIIRTCRAIANQIDNSEFKPEFIEAAFDIKGKFPLIELKTMQKDIYLKGKIDRADVYKFEDKKFIRVIDYKSGNIKYEEKSLYYGNKIQLFIYMHALKLSGFIPAGVYYFPICDKYSAEDNNLYSLKGVTVNENKVLYASDKQLKDSGVSELIDVKLKPCEDGFKDNVNLLSRDIFDKYTNYALNLSKNAIEEILNGNTDISPVDGGCKYCDYVDVCSLFMSQATVRKLPARDVKNNILEAVYE